MMIALIKFMFH